MKNINKIFKLTFLVVILLQAGASQMCRAKNIFYDSKSWIVNVAGSPDSIAKIGLKSKIYPIQVNVENPLNEDTYLDPQALASKLTEENYGKKFINALTADGTSDELLKQLAYKNIQKQDIEFGSNTLIGGENESTLSTFLKDEYLPILMHNYYCFTFIHKYMTKVKRNNRDVEVMAEDPYYAIFKVDVDPEEAFDIIASIGDPAKYNSLSFPVSFVSGGPMSKLEKNLQQEAPDLMLRGVVTRRNPARVSIGRNAGLRAGDLVSIYSQRVDKNGNPYSKRISRARVGKAWDDEAQINFEANTAGNRKNGDIVVRTPDSHTRIGILATWQPHVWGGQLITDTKMSFMRSGVINHFLFNIGYSMTDKPGQKFQSVTSEREVFKSPMFINGGVGYGLSKTFIGFFDIMPYFMAQYEFAFMPRVGEDSYNPTGNIIRVPVGLRFSFNLAYPLRFVLEGGYAFKWGFGKEYEIIKQACDFLGAKRDGLFVNAGFIF